jgi:hypothetical protein
MDHESVLINIIISYLFLKQLKSEQPFSSLPIHDQSSRQSSILLSEVANVHLVNEHYVFRLRDSVQPDLYFPFFNTSKCFSFLIQNFQKSFQLFHLSIIQPEPFGPHLLPLLYFSETFKLLFSVLYDYHFNEKNKSQESVLVVFDYLRLNSQFQNFKLSKNRFL